ncbi:hypothetical protein [Dactylosporangium sp. NPDC049140]|uniref:hypothetical protein n=1 Tax=Dactylosporangium sp. NPDC049140 TaxID=3155647 RepID=UPI003400EF79
MSGSGLEEARRLFDEFRLELWSERHWDSEFTPSPHSPDGKLRELVDGAGPAAAPLLLDALRWAGPALLGVRRARRAGAGGRGRCGRRPRRAGRRAP